MYEFWYDYVKKTMVYRKTVLYGYRFHYIHKNRWYYKDNAEDIETRCDTSSYELDRP